MDFVFLVLAAVAGAGFAFTGRATREPGARKLLYAAGVVVPLMLLAIAISGS